MGTGKPTAEETAAEISLVQGFAYKAKATITKLQKSEEDDGGTDGIILFEGGEMCIEVRRRGFPNHRGEKKDTLKDGFDSRCLKGVRGGIYLNTSTIERYINKSFIFIVEIEGYKPRYAVITNSRVVELLSQPYRVSISTNTQTPQSVKGVPVEWFEKY